MYKIWYYISADWKPLYMSCTNKGKKPHDTDLWKKVGGRVYICNDCGCRMTIHSQIYIEEEEVSDV